MSNPKNSATPKTVAEQAKASNDVTDAVIAGASTEEIAEKVKKTVPAQSTGDAEAAPESKTEESEKKLSLVQTLKAKAEKLKQNKKVLIFLGAAAFFVGVVVKNNLKSKTDESDIVEDAQIHETGEDAADDSN